MLNQASTPLTIVVCTSDWGPPQVQTSQSAGPMERRRAFQTSRQINSSPFEREQELSSSRSFDSTGFPELPGDKADQQNVVRRGSGLSLTSATLTTVGCRGF